MGNLNVEIRNVEEGEIKEIVNEIEIGRRKKKEIGVKERIGKMKC